MPVWKSSQRWLFSKSAGRSRPWQGQNVEKNKKKTNENQLLLPEGAHEPNILTDRGESWIKKDPPGNEAGTWHVTEGVDHGDHQRDNNNSSIHNVQLGAEVHFETKNRPRKIRKKKKTHLPDHTMYTLDWFENGPDLPSDPVLAFQSNSGTHGIHFLQRFLFVISCSSSNLTNILLTKERGNVCVTPSEQLQLPHARWQFKTNYSHNCYKRRIYVINQVLDSWDSKKSIFY